jgi:hypothetical protein
MIFDFADLESAKFRVYNIYKLYIKKSILNLIIFIYSFTFKNES